MAAEEPVAQAAPDTAMTDVSMTGAPPSPTKERMATEGQGDVQGGRPLEGHDEASTATNDDTYDVRLVKDQYGLGIYFTRSDEMAVVDQHVPFYKLPSGLPGPGEASGRIKPGDVLEFIDGLDIRAQPFESTLEALRNLALGSVTLSFRSPAYLPLIETPLVEAAEAAVTLEERNQWLENELARERKCRALADKKVLLYREEVLRLSQVNLELRTAMAKDEAKKRAANDFLACTHLML
ncbi:hypothetical protein SPRG_11110 [Saprolegnia parasitica CBS 223.65]|uniref:PDZ domain-containing protein n=1 Tax=Saprolegnia parasitica (strain CBS 223.65) TaxID=695850 RepID=A0A067CA39_SAPPC|nr:hypothetical protein SPRG_11110 [Saprolegnia parasitica CBS 223.65]KDO23662.1 hypothetical protein SPRG_11110 [Saprolegnia parasitica CBS 223.65]|eukprot:XP_012205645.1 hypothetical protein SPRG_11110 [Saprolegnia parasitica CBS 223.65]